MTHRTVARGSIVSISLVSLGGFQWRIFFIIGTQAEGIVLRNELLHGSTPLVGAQGLIISPLELLLVF